MCCVLLHSSCCLPILTEVTLSPLFFSSTPMLLAVTPFPNPLTTPPVTSTYFILWPCFVHCCCFRSELQCRRVYRRTRLAEIILRQSIGPRCWLWHRDIDL